MPHPHPISESIRSYIIFGLLISLHIKMSSDVASSNQSPTYPHRGVEPEKFRGISGAFHLFFWRDFIHFYAFIRGTDSLRVWGFEP